MGSRALSLCTYPAITKGLFQALPFPRGTWKIHASGRLTLGESTYGMGGSREPREKEVSLLGKIKAYFLEEVPVHWASEREEGCHPPTASCPIPPLSPMMATVRIQAFPLGVRKTRAHAHLRETAEHRGATVLNRGVLGG